MTPGPSTLCTNDRSHRQSETLCRGLVMDFCVLFPFHGQERQRVCDDGDSFTEMKTGCAIML